MEPSDLKELETKLSESWVRIDFTKVDGSHRSMLCTRNFTEIPDDQKPSGNKKQVKESVLVVFDLEKQSWRSIRVGSIQKWSQERSIDAI